MAVSARRRRKSLTVATLEAYYAADERRLRSEEADYGVSLRLQGWDYRWRVSYIRNTGEVYVVHQGATIGPVFVLGYVPPDDVDERDRRSLFYSTLERSWPNGQSTVGDRMACAGCETAWTTWKRR